MNATYVHDTGTQNVIVLDHNGQDMTQVRFVESGAVVWVCDSDLRYDDDVLSTRHSVIVPGQEVYCEWDDGTEIIRVYDGVHFCGACGTVVPDKRDEAYCQDVCPGHHYREGGGENLRTGIRWCPGVERADTDEVFWDES